MKIEKILTIFLLMFVCIQAIAQDYCIFKTSEGVTISRNGEWVEAVKRMNLKHADVLSIPEDGQVAILDRSCGRIYKSISSGKQTVALIVMTARKQADSRIAAFNSTVRGAMSKDKNTDEYTITGVSDRGTGEVLATKVYAALSNLSNGVERTDSLKLAFKTEPDGIGYFEATNYGTTPMVVNIIGFKSGKMFLALLPGYTENDPCVLIGPNESRLFTEYPFDSSSISGEYVLFGCGQVYDSQDLKQLIDSNMEPEQQEMIPIIFSQTLSM